MRIFRLGLKYPTRRRVSLVFLILFTALSGLFIFSYARLDALNTDQLTRSRAIIIDFTQDVRASEVADAISNLNARCGDLVEDVLVAYYVDVCPELGIGMLAVRSLRGTGAWMWALDEIKPTTVVYGRFIRLGAREALINYNACIAGALDKTNVEFKLGAVGSTLVISRGSMRRELKIVGVYKSDISDLAPEVRVLLYVDWTTFNDFAIHFYPSREEGEAYERSYVLVKRIIIVLKMTPVDYLTPDVLRERASHVKAHISEVLGGYLNTKAHVRESVNVSGFRGVVSGVATTTIFIFILAIAYAFLIVKFRHWEIATLRALGWRTSAIRTYLLAELVFVCFVGWLLGVLGVSFVSAFYRLPPISYSAYAGAFVASFVIPQLFGLVIIPRRLLRISPAEAFRRA